MSGNLNKEQQVQVVIRLKPLPKQQLHNRSVYVSEDQDKTLVVETPGKKEYFVFDNIADDNCSQQEIYQYIGQDAVKSSTDGYNCCIFAYGQTGTGKTYSILGNSQELVNDYFAESRGILPRLLSDLFSWCSNETDRFWIKCSYLEIYNQQIIDLLNPELKLRQIRQDFKKGVYVEGLSEENATTYEEALSILLKGVKNRKTSATSMNDESSRSHTIFTLNVESEFMKDDVTKIRRSKINIVDLAGSERAKQTKVEGDRLKQGCNINRSLHVLGNVINALVQSAKKKKHIPFRDSKLTHFLKDSLSGNSITKLLANIHGSKAYLGDTLSTLMFAKRAKILKMKVQVNENMTQNFEQLRKQIRKLREQLAQARYIKQQRAPEKNITQSQNNDIVVNIQKIDNSNFDLSKHEQVLQVFEENQINYKALIQIYEEHMKMCMFSKRKNPTMHQEWKNLEKKNQSYRNILKNMPAFTRIFKQNLTYKQKQKLHPQPQPLLPIPTSPSYKQLDPLQLSLINITLKDQQSCSQLPYSSSNIIINPSINTNTNTNTNNNIRDSLGISNGFVGVSAGSAGSGNTNFQVQVLIRSIRSQYEGLLRDVEARFGKYVQELEEDCEELEAEGKLKDERIKELRRRKELPPDLQELTNQNEYLKLNILQLQNQITTYQQKQRKLQIQLKQLKKPLDPTQCPYSHHHPLSHSTPNQPHPQDLLQPSPLSTKLHQIKQTLQQQILQHQQQRNGLLVHMEKLREIAVKQKEQNRVLGEGLEQLRGENRGLRSKISALLKIGNQIQITRDHNACTNTFWTNQESNISDQLDIFYDKRGDDRKSFVDRDRDMGDDRIKSIQLSNQILKLHKSYSEQIFKLKQQIRSLQKCRKDLTEQNQILSKKLRKKHQIQDSLQPSQMTPTLYHQQIEIMLPQTKSTSTLQRVKNNRYSVADVDIRKEKEKQKEKEKEKDKHVSNATYGRKDGNTYARNVGKNTHVEDKGKKGFH